MLITYYQDGTTASRDKDPLLTTLMVANLLFSAIVLFAWAYVSYFVTAPMSWATWMPITRGHGLVGAFDYPFCLLWFLPFMGACGAWAARKARKRVIAFAFAAIPV
ncbi:MAG: hypothetical protein ACK5JT_24450, partial [Hyphomicrobiaceae bacterium]